EWIIRDMQSPEGGYWSALDADSEGHEGKFYVWDRDEVQALLTEQEWAAYSRRFGLDREPNFEGRWHLHAFRSEEDVAAELQVEAPALAETLESARRKLLEARGRRVWPGRDEKVLTAWNGLTIAGMAAAARALGRADFADSAARAVDFIRRQQWRDGRLLAAHAGGRSRFPAYLDDYAFLLDGLLELLQTRFRTADLQFAIELANALLEHFEDREAGGFFFTANDHEALMHRSKSFADEALPAGAAVAAQSLGRLGLLLGETRLLDAAARALRAGWKSLQRHPQAHCSLLIALEEHLEPPEIVIIRGPQHEVAEWRDELAKLYCPGRLVFAIANDAADLPPTLEDKKPLASTAAYICRGMTCSAPVRSLAAAIAVLRK
ncbi:MAG: hypothetical protein RBS02_13000, partial [Steroidobacteraceae bacterium]|nr:hypothetical protein [Steroidobacteraceae bacterium]